MGKPEGAAGRVRAGGEGAPATAAAEGGAKKEAAKGDFGLVRLQT